MSTAFQFGSFQLNAFQIEVAVWPAPEDVRSGVFYGPNGNDYVGTLVVTSGGSPVFGETFFVNTETNEVEIQSSPGEIIVLDMSSPVMVFTKEQTGVDCIDEVTISKIIEEVMVRRAPNEVFVSLETK